MSSNHVEQVLSEKPLRHHLGIVLSGGAARGFAHIGVLRAFEENGIGIDCISGASVGALTGLFYSSGKTPDEMLDIAKGIKKSKLKAVGPFHIGKAGLAYVEQILKEHVPVKRFEELHKPLYVSVTNFYSGKCEIISTGDIIPALKASVAVPVKFGEQIIGGVPYIDGGMTNNLPAEPLRNICRIVVGVSINPVAYKPRKLKIRHKIMRLTEMLLNENEKSRIQLCDFHFEVDNLGEVEFEAYDRASDIHDMGYRSAMDFLAKNARLLL
jgi:NTE family protein